MMSPGSHIVHGGCLHDEGVAPLPRQYLVHALRVAVGHHLVVVAAHLVPDLLVQGDGTVPGQMDC